MPIVSGDLKAYGSANMPEGDATTSGGAIAPTVLIEFTDLAANDSVGAVSSNGADTMNVTVTGRNIAGAIVAEVITLNGTNRVAGSQVFERILKVVVATAAAGTITVTRNTGGAPVVAIPATKLVVRRMFYDAASEAGSTIRFEKLFLKNEHATLTLTNARIRLTADPQSRIRIGAAPTKDDTASVANRKTSPSSITFVDDNVYQDVPGTTLEAGAAIGVWVEMNLPGGDAAFKNTFTVELSGTTT